jgi:hypothetical protein
MRLVRIPLHLLHVGLDNLDLPKKAHDALRALLADLPLVPSAADSAILLGGPEVTLPSLAILARHVGQGLRDHNLTLAADKARLRVERHKLIFLEAQTLDDALALGDDRPLQEAVLFVIGTTPRVVQLLESRQAGGLASFVTSTAPVAALANWRHVKLTA